MTYNVHGCVGLDFRRSEARIAAVIAGQAPDIVALQELDLGRRRSAGVDQAALIADRLGFARHFHPAMRTADEHYGDAILSRWPLRVRRAGELPSSKAFPFRETRGAAWVEVQCGGIALQVMNTHFGVGRGERLEQAAALCGADWIGGTAPEDAVLVAGDFNSLPRSAAYRILASALTPTAPRATFPTVFPVLAIDHFFHSRRLVAHACTVVRTATARVASDHFPLIADFEILPA